MIVAIVAEKDTSHLIRVIQSISAIPEDVVDVIELRLDCLDEIDTSRLSEVISAINKPYIITLRSAEQGGCFQGSEAQRLAILFELAQLKPTYMDVESLVDDSFISKVHQSYPSIKIIRSYHHFTETPENLDEILDSMRHSDVTVYKIVTYAVNSLDNLRVLHFIKKHAAEIKLVAHCMGALGLPSRVMGAGVGNYFSYASVNGSQDVVPYCPDVHTLVERYRLKQFNEETKVFALLGDPVEHSIGHLFHNKKYTEMGINAVYLKIKLDESELPSFFKQIKGLPFKGFSVTMPLKEKIIPFVGSLNSNCQSIGAVNTIFVNEGHLHATNTDGVGALDAIERIRSIKDCHVLIVGAGGSGKAIAHECFLRKPLSLTIIDRTLSTAQSLAEKVGGAGYNEHSFKSSAVHHFDIIVNTVPNAEENDAYVFNLINSYLSNKTMVLNIDYSDKCTVLLDKIREAGCTIIDPREMFKNQALRQIDYWFSGRD